MKTLYVSNNPSLHTQLDRYDDGEYYVCDSYEGHRVSILKPGIKPRSPKDIAVRIHYPDNSTKPPPHELLWDDFESKRRVDPTQPSRLFQLLADVFKGDEPPRTLDEDWTNALPGLPIPILLHAFKWICIQEDRNFTPPRYMGRRMCWANYLLVEHGLPKGRFMSEQALDLLPQHGYSEKDLSLLENRSRSRWLK